MMQGRQKSNRKRCAGTGVCRNRTEISWRNVRCEQRFGIPHVVRKRWERGAVGVITTVGNGAKVLARITKTTGRMHRE